MRGIASTKAAPHSREPYGRQDGCVGMQRKHIRRRKAIAGNKQFEKSGASSNER